MVVVEAAVSKSKYTIVYALCTEGGSLNTVGNVRATVFSNIFFTCLSYPATILVNVFNIITTTNNRMKITAAFARFVIGQMSPYPIVEMVTNMK